MVDTDEPEFTYGGDPTVPPPEVFEEASRNNPPWYRALEQALTQFSKRPENVGTYADPTGKGATISQIARVYSLFGVHPHCVLGRVLPAAHTAGMERVEQRTVDALLDLLRRLAAMEGELNVPTLHHDGRTGHNIRLTGHDPADDTFEYHDPWPGRSLLCEENNRKGVAAQPSGSRWRVRGEELARVLVACFVFHADWLRMEGSDVGPSLKSLTDGELYRHFHLRPLGHEDAPPITRHAFAPGPFGKSLEVIVDVRPSGRISAARLIADRQWVAGHIDLALDLLKSLLLELAPRGADQEVFERIAQALWGLVHDPKVALAMREADPASAPEVAFVHVFAGTHPRAHAATALGRVELGNLSHNGASVLGLEITHH